jgi:SAM-dependent methyltransferase
MGRPRRSSWRSVDMRSRLAARQPWAAAGGAGTFRLVFAKEEHIWERFARTDAEYYILAMPAWTSRTPKGLEHFFASGRRDAKALLAETSPWITQWNVAVEIGCGVGRLAIPMAPSFAQVRAVDVAPTMLAKLRDNCVREGVTNVRPYLADEAWDSPGTVDFVYSWLVFQHIEDAGEIQRYIDRIGACLRAGGVALLQFDTRRRGLAYAIKTALPDVLLPRPWKRGIRRIRRTPAAIVRMVARARLTIVAELRHRTKRHTFVLRR